MMRVMSIFTVVTLMVLLPLSARADWMQINVDCQGDGIAQEGLSLVNNQDGTHHPCGDDNPAGDDLGYGQWNILDVVSLQGSAPRPTTHDPSMALVDNLGNATDVTLTIHGNFPGWSGNTADFVDPIDDLTQDFLIVDANENPDYISNEANLEITGLTPGSQYEITYIHAYKTVKRYLDCTTDTNGDGSLDGETSVRIGYDANDPDLQYEETVGFTADATGKMIAQLVPRIDGQEGDLAGLRLSAVPEPGTIVLLFTMLAACLIRRRIA